MKKNAALFVLSLSLFCVTPFRSAFAEIQVLYFDHFVVRYDVETQFAEVSSLTGDPLSVVKRAQGGGKKVSERPFWKGDVGKKEVSINGFKLQPERLTQIHLEQRKIRQGSYGKSTFVSLVRSLSEAGDDVSRLVILESNLSEKSELFFTAETYHQVVRTFSQPSFAIGLVFEQGSFETFEDFKTVFENLPAQKELEFSPETLSKLYLAQSKVTREFNPGHNQEDSRENRKICSSQTVRDLYLRLKTDSNRIRFLELTYGKSSGSIPADEALVFYARLQTDEARLHAIEVIKNKDIALDLYQVSQMVSEMHEGGNQVLALIALLRDMTVVDNLAPRLVAAIKGAEHKEKAIQVLLTIRPNLSGPDALSLLAFFDPLTELQFVKNAVLKMAKTVTFSREEMIEIGAKFKNEAEQREVFTHLIQSNPSFMSFAPAQSSRSSSSAEDLDTLSSAEARDILLSLNTDEERFMEAVKMKSNGVIILERDLQTVLSKMTDPKIKIEFELNFGLRPSKPSHSTTSGSSNSFKVRVEDPSRDFKFSYEKTSASGFSSGSRFGSDRPSTDSSPKTADEIFSKMFGELYSTPFDSNKMATLNRYRITSLTPEIFYRILNAFHFDKLRVFSKVWGELDPESKAAIRKQANTFAAYFTFDSDKVKFYSLISAA